METYWTFLRTVHPVLGLLVGLFIGWHLGYKHCRGELWKARLQAGWEGPLGDVIRATPAILGVLAVAVILVIAWWMW